MITNLDKLRKTVGDGGLACCRPWSCRESQMTGPLNNCIAKEKFPLLFKLKNRWFGASLVTQMVKNLPAVQETWVGSLGREDPLEKGQRSLGGYNPRGHREKATTAVQEHRRLSMRA